ncbi:MAG: hypothetical protein LW728_21940 [Microcystis sp. 49638_E5]|jgi:hypothetical protein|uniref:hypothetical protein n=1 Tax=Microcystis sp. 49638_E5 TaxID=2904986 RepID=UPI002589E5CF|nr:hypothetical protein [Microcystis sp. 49638_E5]MCE2671803.1 hypothetical protein [Microcystis sp. 49638_E5]
MIKTIYILTAGECEDKTTIGVFDSIELASFAKEQWDREAYWDKEKAEIEEHSLNYDWNLEKFLDELDKPINVIDPSTLSIRWHGVE